jgi:hypothetical protein
MFSPYRAVNTYVSVIKTSQLMLCREIIVVCSQINTKHLYTVCGQNVEFVNAKLVLHIVTSGLKRVNCQNGSRRIEHGDVIYRSGMHWRKMRLVGWIYKNLRKTARSLVCAANCERNSGDVVVRLGAWVRSALGKRRPTTC